MTNPYFDKYFDMVYYINLASRVDRNEHTLRMLSELNIQRFKRIEAVSADQVNISDIGLIDHRRSISKNNKACKLSYEKCLRDALDNGYEKICVLEDDFCFNQDDPSIKENIDLHLKNCFDFMETHDWQMFYFDNIAGMKMSNGCPESMKRIPDNRGTQIPDTQVRILEGKLVNPDNGGKYKPSNGKLLSHSVAFKGRYIMERILDYEREISIDMVFNAIQEDRHFYGPGLFDQLIGSPSDNVWGYLKLPRR